MNRRKQRVLECAVAAALGAVGGAAYASGFQLMEQNASGLGNAYAGQAAAAEDASTIYFNPAGLTRLPGVQGVAAGHLIVPSAKFHDNGSTPAVSTPGGTGPFALGNSGGDGGVMALIPSMYLSAQITPRIFAGIGVNVPFGLKTDYDPGWMGRFHAVQSEAKSLNVNPSVAFKLSDSLSIGFGANYQHFEAVLTKAVNYSFLAASSGSPVLTALVGPGVEGRNNIFGRDSAWGWNVGVLWRATPSTDLGLAYRSGIHYRLHGSAQFFDRPAIIQALQTTPTIFNQTGDGAITASIKVPATASIAIKHRLGPGGWMRSGWEILADATWTEWSSLTSLDINRSNGFLLESTPFRWKNTWRYGLGANYHASQAWTYRLGAAYDETPVRDEYRTPRIPDQDRRWLALGAQYRLSKTGTVDVGYAHLFVKDANVNLSGPPALTPAQALGRGSLIGSFDGKVDILSIQYKHLF